ncbi:MAG: hypothetical protein IJX60_00545, partial [Paludibacteraceae bacterium]|nr:hypothetical protein [Paludibacteraceae bacterium]
IRFKTQLLNAEVGNDPMKRADMIAQIVISIATIPDIVKRQIYTKDCATFLHIQEDVLKNKIDEVRRNYIEEQKKKRLNEERINDASKTTETIEDTERNIAQSISNVVSPTISIRELNIRNLLQVIIRHGEKPIFQNDNTIIQAGEYIIQELRNDNIEIGNPLYQLILDEYMAHYKEDNWIAANYFQYHPNGEVNLFSMEMLIDKYQLSRMYGKQVVSENVIKEMEIPTEADNLPELIQRLLLELKYTIVNERIDSMQTMLKEAQKHNDWELIRTILEQQPMLMDIRQHLCKVLGNRVILK